MIILELFTSPHCLSGPFAIEVAKEAVMQVPGVELKIRSEKDYARTKSLGLFIFPSFVLDGEFIAVGKPELDWLIQVLKDKVEQVKTKEKKGGNSVNDKVNRGERRRPEGQGNL